MEKVVQGFLYGKTFPVFKEVVAWIGLFLGVLLYFFGGS